MSIITEELSEREIEILRLIATGVSNKEIAQQLNISVNTVKVHVRNIFSKINVTTRTEAAMYAVKTGLMPAAAAASAEIPELEEAAEVEPAAAAAAIAAPNAEIFPPIETKRFPWRVLAALAAVIAVVVVGSWGAYAALSPKLAPTETATMQAASPDADRFEWQLSKDMPTARADMAVALYNSEVYLIAGTTPAGVTDVVERYNPRSDSWDTLAKKTTAVGQARAAALNGKIYVPGGLAASGKPTTVLEIYNPATDEWGQGSPVPRSLYGYALAEFEGKIYLFGGSDGSQVTEEVWMYDPEEDRWTEKTQMSVPRVFPAAVAASGKIFVLGGSDGERALDLAEIYSPEADNGGESSPWRTGANLPEARYSAAAVNLVENVFLVGGRGGGNSLSPVIAYSQDIDQWQEVKAPPMGSWFDMAVVGIGPRLYFFGGNMDGEIGSKASSYQAIYMIMLPLSP